MQQSLPLRPSRKPKNASHLLSSPDCGARLGRSGPQKLGTLSRAFQAPLNGALPAEGTLGRHPWPCPDEWSADLSAIPSAGGLEPVSSFHAFTTQDRGMGGGTIILTSYVVSSFTRTGCSALEAKGGRGVPRTSELGSSSGFLQTDKRATAVSPALKPRHLQRGKKNP